MPPFHEPRRRRQAAVAALLAALALAAGGCSSSGSSTPEPQPAGSGSASGTGAMASTVVLGKVAGNLHQPYKRRFAAHHKGLEKAVGHAVDAWIDGAFVGVDYPRDNFDAAFRTFTPGARSDAERDRRLTTLWDYRHRIDGVTTSRRTVTIDVLAPRGRPAGATARVDLRFTTSGRVQKKVEVRGRLFLTKNDSGSWRIFGYDVTQGAR